MVASGFFESMGTVRDLLKRVESLKLREQVPKMVEQTSYEIVVLNNLQLYSGIDSTGKKITRKYKSKSYAQKKNQLNAKPGYGVPDLFLTGSFYKGMGVVVKRDKYIIDSVDSKSERLETQYGNQIFGLTYYNKSVYAKGVLFAVFKSYIESKTGLKFR